MSRELHDAVVTKVLGRDGSWTKSAQSGAEPPQRAPRFLASVANAAEAQQALRGGAQIVDVKDPAHGALGAAPDVVVRQIVDLVAERSGQTVAVSATVGDLPLQAEQLVSVCQARVASGADIIKVGLVPGAARLDCIAALAQVAAHKPMIAVLFADLEGDQLTRLAPVLQALAASGFIGAMIDTFDKNSGALTQHWPLIAARQFVQLAHAQSLLCGLAGSLKCSDIDSLGVLGADVLGFRGALCEGARSNALSELRMAQVQRAMAALSTQGELLAQGQA